MTDKETIEEENSDNIRPEFRALLNLSNKTKNSFKYMSYCFVGKIKNLKKKINI